MILRTQQQMPRKIHGYLVSVELIEGGAMSPEQVAMRISDSLTFVEGIGEVDIEDLGEIEVSDAADNDYFKSGTRYPGQ